MMTHAGDVQPSGRCTPLTPTSPPTSELPDRCSKWEWAQVGILGASVGWTTLCLGGYLERTVVITTVLNALLLIVHLLGSAVGNSSDRVKAAGRFAINPHPAGWLLLPFLLYAGVNAAWLTPVRWLGELDWLNWAQMVLIFWVVLNGIRSSQARRVLLLFLSGLALLLAVLAMVQRFVAPSWLMLGRTQVPQFLGRSSGSFGQPNSLAGFLVLVAPLVASQIFVRHHSAVRRTWWVYVSALLAVGLVLTISRGAWIALVIALLAAPLVWMTAHPLRRALAAVALSLVLALTGWAVAANVPAVRGRLAELKTNNGELSRPMLWRAAWSLFLANPVTGAGAGSFGVSLDQYRPESFQLEARWAHNDYLNTLSDYGTIGFLLAFGAWAAIGVQCGRRARESRSIVATGRLSSAASHRLLDRVGRVRAATDGRLKSQNAGARNGFRGHRRTVRATALAGDSATSRGFKISTCRRGCGRLTGDRGRELVLRGAIVSK
jgi:O-antigen ligase